MATFGFRQYTGTFNIVHLPEASSQSFVDGDAVIISSGSIAVATDDDDIYGIAQMDASGTTGTMIPVIPLNPSQLWLCQSSATTAESNKGVGYALVVTSGSMAVNPGSTATPAFYIHKLDPRDGAHTGAGGRVIGAFYYTSMDGIGG